MQAPSTDRAFNDTRLEAKSARLCSVFADNIRPPEDIEVDEWAEKHIVLGHRVTARPGRLRLYPFQRKPLRCIKHSTRVVLIWAAQNGKTIVIQCFMGWAVDQYSGPMMIVCPDQPFAKRRSTKHLQPFIQDSPRLRRHLPGNRHDLQVHEYTLDTMSVTIAWAGSPSQMAGEPIMLLGRDEFDKYRDATEKESNAFRLVERRTASYGRLRRIVDATTPTVEDADGWKALHGGTYERFYVPCPHCARAPEPFTDGQRNPGWQILDFKNFRYPARGSDAEGPEELCDWQARIVQNTYYECPDCHGRIDENRRWGMVLRGDWVATNPDAPYPSFHLPSWYAKTETNSFGNVAARYVEGLEDPQAARDWLNSDAAEPARDLGANAREDLIAAHRADYPLGIVPTDRPCILIATADLHKRVHFAAVWALTPERTYLVDCLKLHSTDAVADLRTRSYPSPHGAEYRVEGVFPDAAYRTPEVYDMALADPQIIPTTGGARSGLISWTKATNYPNQDRALDHPLDVLNFADDQFKEQLLLELESGIVDGEFDLEASSLHLPEDTPREYVRHLMAEHVIDEKNKKGYTKRTWKRDGPNHYLDCTKIMLAARYVLRDKLKEIAAARAAGPPTSAADRVQGRKPEGWDE